MNKTSASFMMNNPDTKIKKKSYRFLLHDRFNGEVGDVVVGRITEVFSRTPYGSHVMLYYCPIY